MIKHCRIAAGYSLKEFSLMTGISYRRIAQLEKRTIIPTLIEIIKISQLLKIEPARLILSGKTSLKTSQSINLYKNVVNL